MNSQSILPASCTSSCLMLRIGSSRARNRPPDPVVSCFFGRIAPSDAATESCSSIRENRENEFASFQGLRHGNLAISSQQSRQKTTLTQWVRNSSRATKDIPVNIVSEGGHVSFISGHETVDTVIRSLFFIEAQKSQGSHVVNTTSDSSNHSLVRSNDANISVGRIGRMDRG